MVTYNEYVNGLLAISRLDSEFNAAMDKARRRGREKYSDAARRQSRFKEEADELNARAQKLAARIKKLENRSGVTPIEARVSMLLRNMKDVDETLRAITSELSKAEETYDWMVRNEQIADGSATQAPARQPSTSVPDPAPAQPVDKAKMPKKGLGCSGTTVMCVTITVVLSLVIRAIV
jgi:DNA repair exonuclease SbcCD ATPase subunit